MMKIMLQLEPDLHLLAIRH